MTAEFQPFKLELTFSTLEQARGFYAIFNHTHNTQLLEGHWDLTRALHDHLGPQVYETNRKSVIANGVKYEDFYK